MRHHAISVRFPLLSSVFGPALGSGLLLFLSMCPARPEVTPEQRTERMIGPGVKCITLLRSAGPWVIRVIETDGESGYVRPGATFASERGLRAAPVSTQAQRATQETRYPIAGVNGDFFSQTPGPFEAEPVGALIDLAKRLPGARSGPVGLVGCSIGGASAFALGAGRDDIAAIVADSTAGFVEVTPKAPVLLFTSNQDNSLVVADAHRYEAMFRERGVTVDATYYDNGGHMVMFSAAIRDDARRRAVAFLTKYLKP